jgi:hypothetical protein
MTFEDWEKQYPEAAHALNAVLHQKSDRGKYNTGALEAQVQQADRFEISRQGGYAWRNNVGATPAQTRHTCPRCGGVFVERQQPIRYGLANDSPQLNKRFKSSDLILAIPRIIRPQDVGKQIAQFGSVETKRAGWIYTGKGQEVGQKAWLTLINKIGGFACFSTGAIKL